MDRVREGFLEEWRLEGMQTQGRLREQPVTRSPGTSASCERGEQGFSAGARMMDKVRERTVGPQGPPTFIAPTLNVPRLDFRGQPRAFQPVRRQVEGTQSRPSRRSQRPKPRCWEEPPSPRHEKFP